ncbi:hypothetical protein AB3S75_042986, partial [Citrus x aurantiifolia]
MDIKERRKLELGYASPNAKEVL